MLLHVVVAVIVRNACNIANMVEYGLLLYIVGCVTKYSAQTHEWNDVEWLRCVPQENAVHESARIKADRNKEHQILFCMRTRL